MRSARSLVAALCVFACLAPARASAEAPLVEKYLLEGKLADGARALEQRLKESPDDDQARFGLGVVHFLQTFEHLGASLHRYGLRSDEARGRDLFLRVEIGDFIPPNPNPETLTHEAARGMLQRVVDDLAKVESTLAPIKDANVKLPLHVALVKFDPIGKNEPAIASTLFIRGTRLPPEQGGPSPEELRRQAEALVVAFDRGDVDWLRGYCHLTAAWVELLLSVDSRHAFDCSAHLLFEKVETPYKFLLEDRGGEGDGGLFSRRRELSDVISMIHQLIRLDVKEPARVAAALKHLEAMISHAQGMWKFILAETDDDDEWIPNPKQNSVVRAKVTQEMIDVWLHTVNEAELVLKGEKLLPFWRGEPGKRGLNFRRLFTEPRTFDLIEWFQGVAAAPYLEEGPITEFADPNLLQRMDRAFGGMDNFIGFGIWFN